MPNKPYAIEWLNFAKRNLEIAKLLFDVGHYEDAVGIELQQSLEKMIKAILAFNSIKIPKDHDLVKLYFLVDQSISLNDDEIILLRKATNYFKEDRYPNPYYSLPPREDIEQVLDFTTNLLTEVCTLLNISIEEIRSN
jgi:HEPN domain-containing protein